MKSIYLKLNENLINFKYPLLLIVLLPYSFIAGAAVVEIVGNLIGVYFLVNIFTKKNWDLLNLTFVKIFIVFYIYIVSRSILSADISLSLSSSLFYFRFLFFSLGIFLILKNYENSESLLLKNILFAVTLVSVGIFVEYLYYSKFSPFYDININRYFSLFIDEPIPGSFASRFLPYCVLAVFFFFKNIYKKIFVITFIICTIYISGERTPFFYSLCTLIMFIVFIQLKNFYKLLLIFSLLFSMLFLSLADNRIKSRMVSFTSFQMFQQKHSFSEELKIKEKFLIDRENNAEQFLGFSAEHKRHNYSAYLMFKDNIFFGQGPKMFRKLCKDERFNVPGACATHPHNIILQVLAELGFFGLIFYLIIIFWLLFFFFKMFLKKILRKEISTSEIYCLFYMLAILISYFPLVPSGNIFNNWLNFLIYIGFALTIFRQRKIYD
jgi:O-antigen ligase